MMLVLSMPNFLEASCGQSRAGSPTVSNCSLRSLDLSLKPAAFVASGERKSVFTICSCSAAARKIEIATRS